ncbi:testis-specific serine/threonine-protein kinase 6 [Astyanax mexicanus]|uniref:testis-specific serine/threonine-protein kinase 6 n=1 Tax=Astyanax mexicanus TaxID=7994 RepID=UPI0020CB52D7|nr:testis-specific serine/threonine-protein kinase 6 [Astyanax mexicanus]
MGTNSIDTNEVLEMLGFKVLCELRRGSFGCVKLAESDRHLRNVAIKVIDLKQIPSCFTAKHLPNELAILRTVKHPHIIEMLNLFEMPNREVYIVMEAAPTDLLTMVLEFGRIPVRQASIWFYQLLSAVDYLHQNDIAHRDLKLNNVLLAWNGEIKLTDFGFGCFSKGYPDLRSSLCGNKHYSAPEMHSKNYDAKKNDVWSLGVIFYGMIIGELPFMRSTLEDLIKFQRISFTYSDHVEEPCRAFISYMLQGNPSTRPSVKEVLQHPFLESAQERCLGRFVVVPVLELDFTSQTEEKKEEKEDGEKEEEKNEDEDEEISGCCPFYAAFKKKAKAYVAAPIIRAARKIRKRMKKIFGRDDPV